MIYKCQKVSVVDTSIDKLLTKRESVIDLSNDFLPHSVIADAAGQLTILLFVLWSTCRQFSMVLCLSRCVTSAH